MRRLTTACGIALVLLSAGMGRAQTPAQPDSSALRNLAARLVKAKPAAKPDGSATRFTPNGKRISLDSFVEGMVKGEEDKKNLTTLLTAAFKAYEEAAEKEDVGNDVAGALAFYLAAHYTAYKDTAISDAASNALVRQLQTAFDTDEMRAAKDEEKQKLYEFFIMMGTLTSVSYEMATEQKDAAQKKELRQTGGAGLTAILKVAPERVRLDDTGIHIASDGKPAPTTAAAQPTAAKGPSLGLDAVSYRAPAGWTEKKAEYIITLNGSSDDSYSPFTCTVIIGAPRDRPAKLQDAFAPAWADLIAQGFTGKQPDYPYVCRLESGMNCAFANADMKSNQNGVTMNVGLYLVDSGSQVFPVIVLGTGEVTKFLPQTEKLVNELKVRGATPAKPLFLPAELAGKWTTSDRVYASYVTRGGQYAVDASIATSEIMEFHTDGTYNSSFLGIDSGKATKEKSAGTYRIDGDLLILTSAGRTTKRRIIHTGPAPDGKGRMMLMLNPEYPLRSGNIGLYGEKFFLLPPK